MHALTMFSGFISPVSFVSGIECCWCQRHVCVFYWCHWPSKTLYCCRSWNILSGWRFKLFEWLVSDWSPLENFIAISVAALDLASWWNWAISNPGISSSFHHRRCWTIPFGVVLCFEAACFASRVRLALDGCRSYCRAQIWLWVTRNMTSHVRCSRISCLKP